MRKKTNQEENKRFKTFMKRKLFFFFSTIIVVMCILIGRLIYLNNSDGERYEKRVLSQQSYVSSTLPYQRGNILDRNGTPLAISKKVYNVILDPKVLLTEDSNVEPTINALCTVFTSLDATKLRSRLTENAESSYEILLNKQEFELMAQFTEMEKENKKIKGVWFEEEYERTYPYKSLASHVIGYTSAGDVGTWGIEQYYNSTLNGTNGRVYGFYDAELNLTRTVKEAVNGNSIVSTIDVYIQDIIEQHIATFMEEIGAANVGVIIANPNNGEIYAMASNHSFDLNEPYDLSNYYEATEIASMTEDEKLDALNKMWRNFCISDTYEPGSTFKPITIAAALEEDKVTPESKFVCEGHLMVGGWKIKCNATHGTVTLAQALMKSCNPALMAVGESLGKDAFRIYQDRFGFGKRTGIDLPGEAKGILLDSNELNVTELATSSFGQTFNVTMVQMVAAYSSLINGGYYYQPTLVKEIINDKKVIVDDKDPVVLNETVSATTTEFIREAMYLTVLEGTAKPAQVEGYLIGGKTGTAQKFPRDAKKYVVSFIGGAPADDPQVVIYVILDEVFDEEKKASSTVATTLASKILKDILPYLGIYPDGEIEYRVELPVEKEQQILDEEGNPVVPEDTPFTEDEADAIPLNANEKPLPEEENDEEIGEEN
jgi:stage V sporulation protein D (sporulation-specific penicillin-binding protein)